MPIKAEPVVPIPSKAFNESSVVAVVPVPLVGSGNACVEAQSSTDAGVTPVPLVGDGDTGTKTPPTVEGGAETRENVSSERRPVRVKRRPRRFPAKSPFIFWHIRSERHAALSSVSRVSPSVAVP